MNVDYAILNQPDYQESSNVSDNTMYITYF